MVPVRPALAILRCHADLHSDSGVFKIHFKRPFVQARCILHNRLSQTERFSLQLPVQKEALPTQDRSGSFTIEEIKQVDFKNIRQSFCSQYGCNEKNKHSHSVKKKNPQETFEKYVREVRTKIKTNSLSLITLSSIFYLFCPMDPSK